MHLAVVTGDVHHSATGLFKKKQEEVEIITLREYLDVLREYNSKATIFLTGKLAKDCRDSLKWLQRLSFIEIGGHGYNLYGDVIYRSYYLIRKRMFKFFPEVKIPGLIRQMYYEIDLKRMVNAFKAVGIKQITVLRPHSYVDDPKFYEILPKYGIRIVLNKGTNLHKTCKEPVVKRAGILTIIYQSFEDDFIVNAFPNKKALNYCSKYILARLDLHLKNGFDVVLQLHPICMKLLDNYATMRLILERIINHDYKFLLLTEYVKHRTQLRK